MIERIKSFVLVALVVSSVILSYALLSGVGQYDALPMWLTDLPQLQSDVDEPIMVEPTEILLPEILAPERLVEHQGSTKRLFYLTTNDYSVEVWQFVDAIINQNMQVEVTRINSSTYQNALSNDGWEFVFAGAYPLEVLFPFWHFEDTPISTKVDRLIVTSQSIYARLVSGSDYYRISAPELNIPSSPFALMRRADKGEHYTVYDAGINNEKIVTGVYIAENFLGRYNNLFPEIWVAPERYEKNRWLPRFFSNPNLVREIGLGNERYYFSLGQTSLTLDYAGFPHVDYSYSILDNESLDSISYYAAVDNSSMFLSEIEISVWLDFKRGVRLTSASTQDQARYNFEYRNYADALDVGIPILSSDPAFRVTNINGIVTDMKRHIWQYSRFNYVPKIEIDGAGAIERLSSNRFKVEVWWNPHAIPVIEKFQSYQNEGYFISDVHLAYYVPDNLFSGAFISPYWTVVLADGRENKVRFFINAMTGYFPSQNGLEFR
jgi:hypothetical protein